MCKKNMKDHFTLNLSRSYRTTLLALIGFLLLGALTYLGSGMAYAEAEAGAPSMSKYRTYSGQYDYVIIGNTESYDEAERNCEDVGNTSDRLNLPSRSNVVAAYLYWSGTGDLDNRVQLNGQDVNAERDFDINFWINGGTNYYYGAFADVTRHVNGSGDYEVSNLAWDNKGSYCRDYSAYGGWAMVVVYENSSFPASNIYLYDGFRGYWPDGTVAHDLGGLTVPSSCNPDVDITHVSWEGDNYKGEHFYINDVYFGEKAIDLYASRPLATSLVMPSNGISTMSMLFGSEIVMHLRRNQNQNHQRVVISVSTVSR